MADPLVEVARDALDAVTKLEHSLREVDDELLADGVDALERCSTILLELEDRGRLERVRRMR